jgi:hypothetical protein
MEMNDEHKGVVQEWSRSGTKRLSVMNAVQRAPQINTRTVVNAITRMLQRQHKLASQKICAADAVSVTSRTSAIARALNEADVAIKICSV